MRYQTDKKNSVTKVCPSLSSSIPMRAGQVQNKRDFMLMGKSPVMLFSQ